MEKVKLKELNMSTREESLAFLKRLWNGKETPCPFCGSVLEPLHKKAKKSDCDWQCKSCGRVFRTLHLLDELNEQQPG